jgi:predicted RNase H-like nuclease
VGVDLAWGARAATGLAVLDPAGRIVDIAAVVSDDDIVGYLRPWVRQPCLVAFDAPLVVNNLSGARPCELLVNQQFGRYDAGCHPSNRGMRAFQDGGRAHRIAGLLDLDVDPTSTSPRRAIEVYPHPAIVVLFELDRIIRYKNRPHRTTEYLRCELLRLMSYVEGRLDPADARASPWLDLRQMVASATTKRLLKAVEDRVDAVVCAYIARYSQTSPDAVQILGDGANGYIVTPVSTRPTPARRGGVTDGSSPPRTR